MVRTLKKYWGKAVLLCAVCIIVLFLLPNNYYAQLLCNIASYGIVVTGLDLCFGYSGQISFGHAAFYCIGSYAAGLLSSECGWPPILAFFAAIVISALAGFLLAYPASKVQKHFLSLMTISFGWVVYQGTLSVECIPEPDAETAAAYALAALRAGGAPYKHTAGQ